MIELYHPGNLGKRVEVFLSLQTRYPMRWIVRTYNKAPSSKKRTVLNGESEDDRHETTRTVGLRSCKFFVYEAKRQSCLRLRENGKKDVFAWVIGDLVEPDEVRSACGSEVTYHMRNPHFLGAEGKPIHTAEMAFFTVSGGRFQVFVPPGMIVSRLNHEGAIRATALEY